LITRFQALGRQEDGQALVLCVLVLAALLGIASLAVDGGNALLQRRNQQGVADAAALAAVRELPVSTSTADSVARDYATTKNSADASTVDQVVVTASASSGSCDGGFGATTLAPASVCVVVHSNTTGAFSRLFGIDVWKASARAIAQAAQVTGVAAGYRSACAPQPSVTVLRPSSRSRRVMEVTMSAHDQHSCRPGLQVLRWQPDRRRDQGSGLRRADACRSRSARPYRPRRV